MKVLITGGAGFIGGNFVHHMVNKYPEYDIVNLRNDIFAILRTISLQENAS